MWFEPVEEELFSSAIKAESHFAKTQKTSQIIALLEEPTKEGRSNRKVEKHLHIHGLPATVEAEVPIAFEFYEEACNEDDLVHGTRLKTQDSLITWQAVVPLEEQRAAKSAL
ncbi:hypothetical protein AMTR_s00132p00114970 [Amborella trichopoda]|uniref:Uncharacterized protein n=1 Tax=Amborella trichopoda TaxID=13333 RepID=W1NE81_AMBTC|nr:hypothetical protein AMTR_s00132p00114970 [Amborella trichopoda]